MSNLDYPISILIAERDNIHGMPKNQVDKINRAIDILKKEKHKNEQRKEMVGCFVVDKKYKNYKK